MKPLLYTFVSEETLHSMAVTFYACVFPCSLIIWIGSFTQA